MTFGNHCVHIRGHKMASTFKQDMPPKGGYNPIDYAKKVGKNIKAWKLFGTLAASSLVGYYLFKFEHVPRLREEELLEMDVRHALTPMLEAEKDRLFLAQLRRNRDMENELMKDDPDWITGTWYGEPIYHNQANRWVPPNFQEVYMHSTLKDLHRRLLDRHYRD